MPHWVELDAPKDVVDSLNTFRTKAKSDFVLVHIEESDNDIPEAKFAAFGVHAREDDLFVFADAAASEMRQRGKRHHFSSFFVGDPIVGGTQGNFPDTEVKSLAVFQQDLSGRRVTFLLGFRETQEFSTTACVLHEHAARCFLVLQYGVDQEHSWATLTHLVQDVTTQLETPASLDQIVGGILDRLIECVAYSDRDAHGSIWLADFNSRTLQCNHFRGRQQAGDPREELAFGQGLVGWVAVEREVVNALVRDSGERLPDGKTLVRDQYLPLWEDANTTESELTIPMVYRGRLLAVLNLESPRREHFSVDHELFARILAVHGAQAIYQEQVRNFFATIQGDDELGDLVKDVVANAGNFVEAAYSALFLWDSEEHCLRLEGTSVPIRDNDGRLIGVGEKCYKSRGIGLTKWTHEFQMHLNVKDVRGLDDPSNPQWDDIKEQVRQQCKHLASDERIQITDHSVPGDDRQFWQVCDANGTELRVVPRPTWSNSQNEADDDPTGVTLVPIPDVSLGGPALGVMRFSRKSDQKGRPFTEHDLDLVRAIARHFAQTISRRNREEAHQRGHEVLSNIITQPTGDWISEFQRRLQSYLGEILHVLGTERGATWRSPTPARQPWQSCF